MPSVLEQLHASRLEQLHFTYLNKISYDTKHVDLNKTWTDCVGYHKIWTVYVGGYRLQGMDSVCCS